MCRAAALMRWMWPSLSTTSTPSTMPATIASMRARSCDRSPTRRDSSRATSSSVCATEPSSSLPKSRGALPRSPALNALAAPAIACTRRASGAVLIHATSSARGTPTASATRLMRRMARNWASTSVAGLASRTNRTTG